MSETPHATGDFHIFSQNSPKIAARLEVTSGSEPILRVCDGSSQWTYHKRAISAARPVTVATAIVINVEP
jgi:hypothetical protein